MDSNNIKVSVIIPSYNHQLFIGKAIESVLSQDYNNFELIVADDCSKDNSVKVINSFTDYRLRKFFLSKNLGATEILKFLIKKSRGEYIALLNSDDIWYPEKLKKQVEYLDNNKDVAACFTHANFLNEYGEVYTNKCSSSSMSLDIFNQYNRSRGSWLNKFYYSGNCLCHPSVMIRKIIYDELGYYNGGLRQLPDFDYWIRLILKYPIYILEEVLVNHRILSKSGENTSASTDENCIRDKLEFSSIIQMMMENIDDSIFIEGFKDNFIRKDAITKEELFCEKYFILLNGCLWGDVSRDIAINIYIKNIYNENIIKCFKEVYNYSYIDFYKETGRNNDLLDLPAKKVLAKAYFIVDNKFLEDNSLIIDDIKQDNDNFTYSFYSNMNSSGVRIDLIDGLGILVENISAFINDNPVSIKALNSISFDNKEIFCTLDPQYHIDINIKKFDHIKIIAQNIFFLNSTNVQIVDGEIIETDVFNQTISELIVKMIDRETELIKNNIDRETELIKNNIDRESKLNQNIIDYENLIGFKLIKKLNQVLIKFKMKS